MKKKDAMKWVKALRSGKYKQGKEKLYCKETDTYCCLGVLNAIYPKLNLSGNSEISLKNHNKIGLPYSTGFEVYAKLPDRIRRCHSLSGLNDDDVSFDEIADLIQIEYVEGL